jgi:regulator of replication initiation timing
VTSGQRDELGRLRESEWRLRTENSALRDTIAALRTGANSLAVENAMLQIENDHFRRLRAPCKARADRDRSG